MNHHSLELMGIQKISSGLKSIYLEEKISKYIPLCIFYSTLFYWFWTLYSDCYNLKLQDVFRLPIDLEDELLDKARFFSTYSELIDSMYKNGRHVKYNKKNGLTEYFEFKPRLSKNIFDKVDELLATYYGFNKDELEFIINYDRKYRVNDEGNKDDEL